MSNSTQTRVTRRDVARYAGVSTAVVSYVVNDGPKAVAPATAARVREAIKVLRYQPDANGRALSLGSSRLIGLVAPDMTNPFFAELAAKIADKARQKGFAILQANSNADAPTERENTQSLVSRRVDAMIIASILAPDELAAFPAMGIRRVLVDQSDAVHGLACIGTDSRQGSNLAVNHLISHGHRDIALIVGDTDALGRLDPRGLGWRNALEKAGLPPGRIAHTDFTRQGGYRAMQSLLADGHRPTAVFTSSDLEGVGALRAIHEAGLDIPEDIAVVSFDGSSESEFSWPALTSVKQDIGRIAEVVLDAALTPEPTEGLTLIPGELIIRSSCGC